MINGGGTRMIKKLFRQLVKLEMINNLLVETKLIKKTNFCWSWCSRCVCVIALFEGFTKRIIDLLERLNKVFKVFYLFWQPHAMAVETNHSQLVFNVRSVVLTNKDKEVCYHAVPVVTGWKKSYATQGCEQSYAWLLELDVPAPGKLWLSPK